MIFWGDFYPERGFFSLPTIYIHIYRMNEYPIIKEREDEKN